MFGNNLLSWLLDVYILSHIQISDKQKEKLTLDQHSDLVDKLAHKWGETHNYLALVGVIPNEYFEPLTPIQKAEIKEYMENFYGDAESFTGKLWLLCHIGKQFEEANQTETSEYKALVGLYEFMKTLFWEKYPNWQPEPEKEELATCPKCGSLNIGSFNREQNYCRDCRRRWRK